MIKDYKKNTCFLDYLTMGDHGRTGVFAKTDDGDVLLEKTKLGWTFEITNGGFWLRSPDISLVDITEPFRIYQLGENDVANLACFRFLRDLKVAGNLRNFVDLIIKKNKSKYINFEYYISDGQVLEGEIRIGGCDQRIYDLKKDILREVVDNEKYKCYLKTAEVDIGVTRKIIILNKEVNDFDSKSIEIIDYLNKLNSLIYQNKKNVDLNVVDKIIGQLPEYDVLIFIPTGCYRYISSFLSEKTSSKIMFWEKHIDRNQTKSMKTLVKSLKGKRCLIVDKSYTGKTHNLMSRLVLKEEGFPIRLALFPKGKLAINNSDYFLFLDKIFESKTIRLNEGDWLENCYKNVLSINN